MSGLISIREAILTELEPIRNRRNELKEEDVLLAEEEIRLEGALKEIDGKGQKKPKGKTRTSGKKKDTKPSVKKEHVQPVCIDLVKSNPGITKDDLAALAADKLKEIGFGQNGLTMQIGKCIASDLFMVDANGNVAVTKASTPPVKGFNADSNGSQLSVENLDRFRKSS